MLALELLVPFVFLMITPFLDGPFQVWLEEHIEFLFILIQFIVLCLRVFPFCIAFYIFQLVYLGIILYWFICLMSYLYLFIFIYFLCKMSFMESLPVMGDMFFLNSVWLNLLHWPVVCLGFLTLFRGDTFMLPLWFFSLLSRGFPVVTWRCFSPVHTARPRLDEEPSLDRGFPRSCDWFFIDHAVWEGG